MQLEVYETPVDALDAAAALAEDALAAGSGRRTLAVAGGRGGRALMVALAARERIPWQRLAACVADERCVPYAMQSHRRLLRENLLAPRRVPGPPADAASDPAAAYAAEVDAVLGAAAAFDLLVLDLGPRGALGALVPDSPALADTDARLVRVAPPWTPEAGEDAWIGLGPHALARAGRVIVTALGGERSTPLTDALAAADGVARPTALVLPSARVTWIVDRAAAAALLRDARPA